MRIATVLAVATAYGVFVDALAQDEPGHSMLRDLSAQNYSAPGHLLMADGASICTTWGGECTLSASTNSLQLGTTCPVLVPIPSDNYVADKRLNKNDDGGVASSRPYIQITSTGPNPSHTDKVAWKTYLTDPSPAKSQVTFNKPGVYDVSIAASDYNGETTCPGCINIKDTFRPRFAGGWSCNAAGGSTTLSAAALTAQSSSESNYDTHVHNVENNADSGGDCGSYSESWQPFTATTGSAPPATGNTLATSAFTIKPEVQTASNNVIHEFASVPIGADASKNVYYGIPCTSLDGTEACKYNVKLSDLITVKATSKDTQLLTDEEVSRIVKWRYNYDGLTWHDWDPASTDKMVFGESSTTVHIEAWSMVGKVGATLSFNVNLFVHSTMTCANFDAMWAGVGVEMEAGGAYCNVPRSDFTVLHLNFQTPQEIVPAGEEQVQGTFKGFKCTIMAKENGATDTTPATLLERTGTQLPVSQDFAVELVHKPNTAQKTFAQVKCTFTREAHTNTMLANQDSVAPGYNGPHELTCTHDFAITDCDKPKLHTADTDVCANKCADDSTPSAVGLGELCNGLTVTSNAVATSVNVPGSDQVCCDKCGPDLSCRATGTSVSVKRCAFEGDTPLFLAELAAAEEKVFSSETVTALLGASAMIAVVALIVVKRRADAAARAEESDDAYYPLLE
uniref:PKD domain-containing protein n=1 Tax=Phytophthora ramorum TaxID=164328 RepID=H3GRZ3_PHYRM